MKKLILVFLAFALFFSCKKDENQLVVTVLDEKAEVQASANIKLFMYREGDLNPIPDYTFFSDAKGVAKLSGIEPGKYLCVAFSGCKNSYYNAVNDVYILDEKSKYTSIVGPVGQISITNNSSNPYLLYVNNTLLKTLTAKSQINVLWQPAGFYNIKVSQVSGFLLYPSEYKYEIDLKCGESKTISFP